MRDRGAIVEFVIGQREQNLRSVVRSVDADIPAAVFANKHVLLIGGFWQAT